MANGVIQLIVIGLAIAGAIGAWVALNPVYGPNEDVSFLEQVAATVGRARVIAPETRDFLVELTKRHQARLAEPQLDLRRREALKRIVAATRRTDRPMWRLVGAPGLEPGTR